MKYAAGEWLRSGGGMQSKRSVKPMRSFIVITVHLGFAALTAFAGHSVAPGSPLIPSGSGLAAGDSFHLVFATSTSTNPQAFGASRTIADFNSYVNTVADGSSIDGIPLLNWFVIGSTTTVAAKENAVVTGPVYRVGDDVKVADDAADMWDGALEALISRDESGNDLSASNWQAWTGTLADGTEGKGLDLDTANYGALGGAFIDTPEEQANWINVARTSTARDYRFYALLETITIDGPQVVLILRR